MDVHGGFDYGQAESAARVGRHVPAPVEAREQVFQIGVRDTDARVFDPHHCGPVLGLGAEDHGSPGRRELEGVVDQVSQGRLQPCLRAHDPQLARGEVEREVDPRLLGSGGGGIRHLSGKRNQIDRFHGSRQGAGVEPR